MEQLNTAAERINGVLRSTPLGQKVAQFPVTTFVGFFSLFFHFLCLVLDPASVVGALAVSPSATLMNGKFWTLFTSALVEDNTTKFALFGGATLVACYQLELESGSKQLATLVVVSSALASLLSAISFVAVYMTTLNDEIFFSNVYGLGGLLVSTALAMAKAYLTKNAESATNILAGRLFAIPLALAGYSLLGLKFPLHDALLVVFSFFIALGILRSDNFTFRHFFPIAGKGASSHGTAPATPVSILPTPDPTKERFRARGFKLLDKKLAELEAAPEIPLDIGDKADAVANSV